MDEPVRCEFFDDEIDSLGSFDTATQRRTKNLTSALLLPASELPEGAEPSTAFAYLPGDALVCLNETARLGERVKNVLWQAREDTESLLAAGEENGDLTRLLLSQGEWLEGLEGFALCMLEALPTSRYPLPPRTLLSVTAKQLSAYGGSIDAAAGEIGHYLSSGFGVLLLCGSAARARSLQRMLQERDVPAALDFDGASMPGPGEARIAVGALSAGAEYPQLNLAVLTEGQLTAPASGRTAPAGRPRTTGRSSSATPI